MSIWVGKGVMMNSFNMCECPRFDRCSAPVCSLDPEWNLRVYHKGEPICFYLLEYVKPDAKVRFRGRIAILIYEAIEKSIDAISHRYAPLCRALERTKRTGSRMKMLEASNQGGTSRPSELLDA